MPDTNYTEFTAGLRCVPGRTDSSGTAVNDISGREDALINEVLTEGVVKPDGAFEPSKGSGDFDVDLGSGTADADLFVVESQVTGQAPYLVQLQATSVTVTLDAADADARIDEVYLVVLDEGRDSNAAGLTLPRISYRKGDSASSPVAPGPDAAWEAWALLASIPVSGGASSISAGDITDERVAAHLTHLPPGLMSGFAGDASAVPAGWVVADGQSLSRSTYYRLFSVIGTTYGEPDSDSFNVPDWRDRVMVGAGSSYSVGTTFGSDSVQLTESELPAHTHSQGSTGSDSHSHTGTTDSDNHNHDAGSLTADNTNLTVDSGAGGQVNTYSRADGDTSTANHDHTISGNTGSDSHSHSLNVDSSGHSHTNPDTNSTGGDGSHENRQPSMAVTPLISI